MNGLKCIILCKSVHHRNTARVAMALAGPLGAEVTTPEAFPYTSLDEYGLVGFGSGVSYGRLHPGLVEWLSGLPDAPGQARRAFLFSTSGLPFLATFWHSPVRRLLARKGFQVVGEFSCRGFDTWGPLRLVGGLNRKHPDERDLGRALAFARELGPSSSPRRQSRMGMA